jgi:hypothetical protein
MVRKGEKPKIPRVHTLKLAKGGDKLGAAAINASPLNWVCLFKADVSMTEPSTETIGSYDSSG